MNGRRLLNVVEVARVIQPAVIVRSFHFPLCYGSCAERLQ